MRSWWTMIFLCTLTYFVGYWTSVTTHEWQWRLIDNGIFVLGFVGGAYVLMRSYRRKENRRRKEVAK